MGNQRSIHFGLLLLEVAEQILAAGLRFEVVGFGVNWRYHLLSLQLLPAKLLEILHILNFGEILHSSSVWVFEQESADQCLPGRVCVVLGEAELVVLDFLVDADGVVRVAAVGQNSTDHFVEDDAQRPDVNRERVPLGLHYLRRHVVWSSDYGEGSQSLLLR